MGEASAAAAAAASAFPGDDGVALATMDIFAGCGGLSEGMHQAGELRVGVWVGGGGWGVGGSAMEVGGKGPGPQRMAACNRACNPAAQPHPPRLISVFCSLCPHICRLTPHLPTGAAVAKWGIEYEKPAAAAFKVNNPEVS